jgi:hypothetical protein
MRLIFIFKHVPEQGNAVVAPCEDIKDIAQTFLKVLMGMGACRMADAYHWLQNVWGEDVEVKTYNKSDTKRWVSANKYSIGHIYGNLGGDNHILGTTHIKVEADKPGQWFWVKCGDYEWKAVDKGLSKICQFLHSHARSTSLTLFQMSSSLEPVWSVFTHYLHTIYTHYYTPCLHTF